MGSSLPMVPDGYLPVLDLENEEQPPQAGPRASTPETPSSAGASKPGSAAPAGAGEQTNGERSDEPMPVQPLDFPFELLFPKLWLALRCSQSDVWSLQDLDKLWSSINPVKTY